MVVVDLSVIEPGSDTTTLRTWSVIYMDVPLFQRVTPTRTGSPLPLGQRQIFPTRASIPIGDIVLVHGFLWSTGSRRSLFRPLYLDLFVTELFVFKILHCRLGG